MTASDDEAMRCDEEIGRAFNQSVHLSVQLSHLPGRTGQQLRIAPVCGDVMPCANAVAAVA